MDSRAKLEYADYDATLGIPFPLNGASVASSGRGADRVARPGRAGGLTGQRPDEMVSGRRGYHARRGQNWLTRP
jgi:hypothetical protein